MKVNEQSPAVAAMSAEWGIASALLGGTAAMRKQGQAYLPKWPKEDEESYRARLSTATLYPAFGRTVSVMSGKPFSKALTYGDDVPDEIKELCQDVDLHGNNLHVFASALMSDEVLPYGISGVLVDYPTTTGLVTNLADEKKIGARPYFVLIRHEQILGWKAKIVNGEMQLLQLRLMEAATEDVGEFGEKQVNRVRVLEPGKWALYEENDKHEFMLHSEGVTTLDAIPYVPFYGKRTGFMTGQSPLLDLAYLNVKHWQSQSDQDTILHVARVPILAVIGAEDDKWSLSVGASTAVKLPLNGDMKFVEHTGAAIDAGAKSLADLEMQMVQTGAELLVQRPSERSATESSIDAEANKCELQRLAESFEDGLDQCLQFMADWLKMDEGGHIMLFKDYGAGSLTDASAQLIVTMQQGGLITKQTALREQQRRGVLSPDLDPDDELEAVAQEGPALGVIGGDGQ